MCFGADLEEIIGLTLGSFGTYFSSLLMLLPGPTDEVWGRGHSEDPHRTSAIGNKKEAASLQDTWFCGKHS